MESWHRSAEDYVRERGKLSEDEQQAVDKEVRDSIWTILFGLLLIGLLFVLIGNWNPSGSSGETNDLGTIPATQGEYSQESGECSSENPAEDGPGHSGDFVVFQSGGSVLPEGTGCLFLGE